MQQKSPFYIYYMDTITTHCYSIFVVVVVVQFIWQPCSDCAKKKIRKNNDVCEPTSVFAGVK